MLQHLAHPHALRRPWRAAVRGSYKVAMASTHLPGVRAQAGSRRGMVRRVAEWPSETAALASFLICMVVAGLLLIRAVTPFAGFDEAFHWFRVLQISRGVPFAARLAPNDWGGAIDLHGIKFAYWFAEKFAKGVPVQRQSVQSLSESLAATAPEHGTVSFPSSASFAPTAYLPAAVAVLTARNLHLAPLEQTTAGRLVQLFTYAALLSAVILVLPKGRLLVLALLSMPTPLHLATCFSADPVNIALLALFIALCLRLRAGPPIFLGRRNAASLLGLAFLLGTLKLAYVPAVLFLLLIPADRFSTRRARWLFVASGAALCLVTALTWTAWYPFVPGPYWHAGGDPAAALAFMRSHPVNTANGLFHTIYDNLGYYWRDLSIRFGGGPAPYHFWAPAPLAWIELAGLFALAVLSGGGRRDLQTPALCLLVAACILGLLLVSFRIAYGPPDMPLVQGLQGRYFIPVILLLGLAILNASPLSLPKMRLIAFFLLLCNHIAVCAYAVRQYARLYL